MRRYFIILLCISLLIGGTLAAKMNPYIAGSGVEAGCADSSCNDFLICQNFEGTGYDNSESWTNPLGSIDEDYTTTVLRGSQSLHIDGAFGRAQTPDFTASGFVSLHYMFRMPATNASTLVYMLDSTDAEVCVGAYNGTDFYLTVNSVPAGVSATLSANTTYHIWIDLTTGTGSNGEVALYVSTSSTKPTTATDSADGLGNSTDIQSIILTSTTADNLPIYDQILIDDTEISDVCD